MRFSERLSGVYDAYETWAVLDELNKRVAQGAAWVNRQTIDWPETFYAQISGTGSYIEIGWGRRQEAQRACAQAIEHYRDHFWAAATEPQLRDLLLRSGLPYSGDLKRITDEYALAAEPRWKQLLSGGYRARGQGYLRELPEDTPAAAVLNVPTPFTAVEASRAASRDAVARIVPLAAEGAAPAGAKMSR